MVVKMRSYYLWHVVVSDCRMCHRRKTSFQTTWRTRRREERREDGHASVIHHVSTSMMGQGEEPDQTGFAHRAIQSPWRGSYGGCRGFAGEALRRGGFLSGGSFGLFLHLFYPTVFHLGLGDGGPLTCSCRDSGDPSQYLLYHRLPPSGPGRGGCQVFVYPGCRSESHGLGGVWL